MAEFSPENWIELAKVTFAGLTTVLGGIAAVYAVLGARRAGRAEAQSVSNNEDIGKVSTNVDRLEKNTNSISERNQAIAMKLGIADGIAQERASVLANASQTAPSVAALPLPVTDHKAAEVMERVVDAIHDSANGIPKKD